MKERRHIPVEEAAKEWFEDPAFVEAYDALEEEFALASAMIRARSQAALTQEEVAKRMGTSQAAVARIESGRSNVTTRTLQRYAEALGMRLKVSFEPAPRS